MVSFAKPNFTFDFDFNAEVFALKAHKSLRNIPEKNEQTLLLATWNIANLGLQKRGEDHYRILANVLSCFDIVAVQEVHDNLEGLYKLEQYISS